MKTNDLCAEGSEGIHDLCRLARELGYKDPLYQLQISHDACVGDLLEFLRDNPGAIEALYDWVHHNYPDEETCDET
jgi:hypothetical protein